VASEEESNEDHKIFPPEILILKNGGNTASPHSHKLSRRGKSRFASS